MPGESVVVVSLGSELLHVNWRLRRVINDIKTTRESVENAWLRVYKGLAPSDEFIEALRAAREAIERQKEALRDIMAGLDEAEKIIDDYMSTSGQ